MASHSTIYLGGPDVFLPNAIEVGRMKMQMCVEFGFEGLFPLDNDEELLGNPEKIFRVNRERMDKAKIGLFNLTPFRGPSADVGTVFELGYMFAQEKRLFGYTSDKSAYWERLATIDREKEQMRDADGLSIEPFGLIDNLVVVRSIIDSGGFIEKGPEQLKRKVDVLPAFKAFRICLEKLKQQAGRGEFDGPAAQVDAGERAAWADSRFR